MPNPVLRVLPSIGALLAALLIAGAGAGVAVAVPGDTGDGPGTDEPVGPPAGSQPGVVEPEPTTATPPSIFDIPRNIATQLRDMMGRPLSIFGNGRTPGTRSPPDGTVPAGDSSKRKRDKDRTAAEKPTVPEQATSAPVQQAPAYRHTTGSVDVTPPSSAPPISVPGYQGQRWTLDLSDPFAAFTAMGKTLSTVNSLLADAYAPYNPFKPKPPPQPAPTFRTMEEGPVDAVDTVDTTPMASGSDLPVVQVPVIIPPVRLAPSRPITGSVPATGSGSVPAGEGRQVLGAGPAGVPAPAVRGSVTQNGSTPTEQLPPNGSTSAGYTSAGSTSAGSTSAMGNPVLRDGYPQYLRSARMTQVATVALPGLAGLIALTASGSVIGYRQANSGRYLRSEAERFIQ
ncbi:MAG: hypothetical protein QOI01_2003 [Mycobacterium sp.]|nr:hypothetical protein [Mycobacterium sp.]